MSRLAKLTARERATHALDQERTYSGSGHAAGLGAAIAGKRIGWSLLAVADAISDLAGAVREHTEASRPPQIVQTKGDPPFPPFAGGDDI